MKIISATLTSTGQFGPELHLHVSGLHPEHADDLPVVVPLVCLPDRRLRDGISPGDEPDFLNEETGLAEGCRCATCPPCTAALEVVLAEHYARLNPDKLHALDTATAERLVQLGGVPGKVWHDEKGIIDVAPPAAPKVIQLQVRDSLVEAG